jgi:non-canonical poly(A) RNA polymerase PAPD5/7
VNFPWLSDNTLSREGSQDLHGFLHNEILDYCKWIEPSPEDKASRQSLVKKIKRVVKESYPDAVVMVFGSCATGLNLPNSDIDLLVYYPEVKELSMLNKLCNTLVKQIDVMSIEALKHTKVPLIKLQEKHSKINVDISFNRTNGIYCVKLVKFLMKKYPELRPLILILKAFLKSRELNETYHGGVGSFLLTMLVTSYLQRHYKLGGTDKKDLGFHLIEFFNLYGNLFNYDQVGISIRKEGSYFSKDKKGWEQYDQNRCRLSVENPQDPDIDIGRPAYNIHRIKRAF